MQRAITVVVVAVVTLCAHACAPTSGRDAGSDDGVQPVGDDTSISTGSIVGVVCNRHSGDYLDGVARIVLPRGNVLEAAVVADDGGAFRFDSLPVGPTSVVVRGGDYQRTYRVNVLPGAETVIDDGITCEPYDPLTTGAIVGRVCDGGGVTVKLAEAIDGIEFGDETNASGDFAIAGIPTDGTRVVDLVASDGTNEFRARDVQVFPSDVAAGGTVINSGACIELRPVPSDHALIVSGIYDDGADVERNVDAVVDHVNGNPIDFNDNWADDVFADARFLDAYVLLTLGDGVDEGHFQLGLPSEQKQNLRAYVEDGGAVWTRGSAFDVVEQVWPERINVDDNLGAADVYAASVVDPQLAADLGRIATSVLFQYAFPIVAQTTGTVLLTAPVSVDGAVVDAPIAVLFEDGDGRVLVTSFGAGSVDDDVVSALLDRL